MIVKIDFGFSPPWFVVWILIPCFKFIESQTVDFVLARLVCLFVAYCSFGVVSPCVFLFCFLFAFVLLPSCVFLSLSVFGFAFSRI